MKAVCNKILLSRSLLLPKPLKEIRVKGQYDEFKEVAAAQGVKIAARDLEKAIAGLNMQVAYHEDEVDLLKEEVDREFKTAMRSIKVGVLVCLFAVRQTPQLRVKLLHFLSFICILVLILWLLSVFIKIFSSILSSAT